MLGARGVQVGTRFVVAEECIVHQHYKDAIIKAKDTDTCATGRSTGHPVRVIKNKLAKEILALEKTNEGQDAIDKVGIGALSAAVFKGDMQRGSIMSGQIAGLIKKQQSASEIIKEIFEEVTKVYEDRAVICGAGSSVHRNG
jgi:enoyl-[acyl-carrier protein] reductase II